ncbi:TetR-like C-terminal domain-containing protein [Streptomyces sp. SID12488]|uniref:WHG domain-containing protein n=1 Tax=Streptomyces sp. SID12488 TaxID=2706040 RepID=UPI0013D8F558|nr:TetR/AcrR family transcriptional regulator [Streptomyces sp. SID12488]
MAAAGAALADEIGFSELTMGRLAERLGVRAPSLYKHIAGQDDLHRRIAALAFDEAGVAIGTAIQGRTGRDALAAAAGALRDFVLTHPGRYAATLDLTPTGPDDPVALAAGRGISPFAAVLRGYDIDPQEMTHALRAVRSIFHGFAHLQVSGGFQWSADVGESFEYLIDLVDRGLRSATAANPATTAATDPADPADHHR